MKPAGTILKGIIETFVILVLYVLAKLGGGVALICVVPFLGIIRYISLGLKCSSNYSFVESAKTDRQDKTGEGLLRFVLL